VLRGGSSRVTLMDNRVNECYPGFFVLYFWDGIMALEEDQFILIDDPLPDVA
jgi:hypothetical protein